MTAITSYVSFVCVMCKVCVFAVVYHVSCIHSRPSKPRRWRRTAGSAAAGSANARCSACSVNILKHKHKVSYGPKGARQSHCQILQCWLTSYTAEKLINSQAADKHIRMLPARHFLKQTTCLQSAVAAALLMCASAVACTQST